MIMEHSAGYLSSGNILATSVAMIKGPFTIDDEIMSFSVNKRRKC